MITFLLGALLFIFFTILMNPIYNSNKKILSGIAPTVIFIIAIFFCRYRGWI